MAPEMKGSLTFDPFIDFGLLLSIRNDRLDIKSHLALAFGLRRTKWFFRVSFIC